MIDLTRGRYHVRRAAGDADLRRSQSLRARAFGLPDRVDADRFDEVCDHVLVEDLETGQLVCCFRMQLLQGGDIAKSYSAQFYDLTALAAVNGPMVEIGRFCVDAGAADPDVLRVAWGALAQYVDACGVSLLFGCSSFRGIGADTHLDAFALLRRRHLAPKHLSPRVKAPEVAKFEACAGFRPDTRRALQSMPPLLRTYLMMGGWVSDHAVVDRQMNTLHVFTCVEVAEIPEARKRALRQVAG